MNHLLSPFLYILFVEFIKILPSCPDSMVMKKIRFIHNYFLSILSFIMLLGITIGNYQTDKFSNVRNLLCLTYNNNYFANISVDVFLYSKYLEWLDTLFLHLSNKEISNLQYYHHMSTALLVYLNKQSYLSPHVFVFMSLNCFVHIFMYWYFAYPHGILKKFRMFITLSQIVQHILCLLTVVYTMTLKDCDQNKYGNITGLFLYLLYLGYFSHFYCKNYFKKKLLDKSS